MADRNVIAIAWDWVKPGGWDFATYTGEAQAPVLYKYDSSGFISAAPNRNITIQDGTYINEYNQRVATRLQEQDTTLNQLLQQTMPNWQPVAKDLNFLSNPTANYSNEGRNYKTQTYNFGPNYRGYGFTDPRILDTSESYRSLNPTNSASINQTSQTSSSGGSGGAWNTIGGGTSGFGGSTVQPGSMTNTAPNQGPGYPTPTVTQSSGGSGGSGGGGNSGFGGSKVQPGSATNTAPNQGPGWAPIVIDLDGDGVEIKPLSRSSTTFDADSDGYKERSAWAGADDGLLVIDLNGDGQVTQSKEIAFSEWTAEQDTDLQALAKVFDSNGDGTFDSRDSRFNEFRIGKDANSNGVADAGEMMMLQEAGIAANDANYRRCA